MIDAMLLSGFDPSSGCTDVFGVCESFAVFETDDLLGGVATFTGFSNISFILPTLPTGFQWLTLDENNNAIVLEIEGMKSFGGGGGGTTPAPEPSDWMLLVSGSACSRSEDSRAGIGLVTPNARSETPRSAPGQRTL